MDYLKENGIFPNNLSYGFWGRKGGVGTGNYDSLNICDYSDDDKLVVDKNKKIISDAMGMDNFCALKHKNYPYP